MILSVVIPCYNSESTLDGVVDDICDFLNKWKSDNKEDKRYDFDGYEIILINDGSKDLTFEKIKALSEKHPQIVKGLNLSYNAGQHNAIVTAYQYVSGDIIIGMDDDGQTLPTQIPKLINKLNEGYDVVYGKYEIRKHSFKRNFASKINHLTYRLFLKKPKNLFASNFYVAKKFVVKEIAKYPAKNINLQGLFLKTTAKIVNTEIKHQERSDGKSNYNFKKLLKFYASILNFSLLPLRFMEISSIVLLVISVICGSANLIGLIHLSDIWKFALIQMFFCAIFMCGLSIVAEYIGRMFLVVLRNPKSVVSETIGITTNQKVE